MLMLSFTPMLLFVLRLFAVRLDTHDSIDSIFLSLSINSFNNRFDRATKEFFLRPSQFNGAVFLFSSEEDKNLFESFVDNLDSKRFVLFRLLFFLECHYWGFHRK